MRAEKHVVKDLDVKPKDIDAAVQDAAKEVGLFKEPRRRLGERPESRPWADLSVRDKPLGLA